MNEIKCPQCDASHYAAGGSSTTLTYYQPIYKDGVNVNPDKNITTTSYTCQECNNSWEEKI